MCTPPHSSRFIITPLPLQAAYEETLQHKLGLQKRLQSLRAEEILQETPGKQRLGAGAAAASELVQKLLQRQEQLEVRLEIQGSGCAWSARLLALGLYVRECQRFHRKRQ